MISLILVLMVLGAGSSEGEGRQDGDQGRADQRADQRPSRDLAGSGTRRFPKDETSISNLLLSKVVQKEIGLTDEQFREIDALWRQQAERSQLLMMQMRNARDPEARAAIEAALGSLQDEFHVAIRRHLKPQQVKRLLQIAARNAGIRAVASPEIADAIGLSPPQRASRSRRLPCAC
ncbi:MAG: hypothetical protein IRY99_27535 [Isosphaeraceae bacterium]|nr:hypothetical protein [Isosphaeraceae bacterium]